MRLRQGRRAAARKPLLTGRDHNRTQDLTYGETGLGMRGRIRRWLGAGHAVEDFPAASLPAEETTPRPAVIQSYDASAHDAVDDIERDILLAMQRLTKELGEVEQRSARLVAQRAPQMLLLDANRSTLERLVGLPQG